MTKMSSSTRWTAQAPDVAQLRNIFRAANPKATIVEAACRQISIDDGNGEAIRGKRVLAVEDRPAPDYGDVLRSRVFAAEEEIWCERDRQFRPYAVGSISKTFKHYPKTGAVLPAMGYGAKQVAELEATINATPVIWS